MKIVEKTISPLDKALAIVLIFCVIFWFLSKVEALHSWVLFGVFYEMFVLMSIPLLGFATLYFLYKTITSKFSLSQPYLFVFLLGVAGLLVMRFVNVFVI